MKVAKEYAKEENGWIRRRDIREFINEKVKKGSKLNEELYEKQNELLLEITGMIIKMTEIEH